MSLEPIATQLYWLFAAVCLVIIIAKLFQGNKSFSLGTLIVFIAITFLYFY